MPFVIDDVLPRDETATKTFDILGTPAEITYYRNRLTLDTGRDITGSGDQVIAGVASRLCGLVADWDLEGPLRRGDGSEAVAAGQPVPVEPEVVRHFPLPLIRAITEAIGSAEGREGNAPRRSRR